MTIIRKFVFITTLALAGGVLSAAAASAAPFCPTSESFFGTVQRVNGTMLTVQTPSGHTADVDIASGARINTNGFTLRSGIFVGAYGCVTPNGVFHANELTLADNSSKYSEQVSGVVQRVASGRLIVRETNGMTGAWFVPDVDEFHVGQSVSGVGVIAANGSFYPQTINGRMVAFDTDVTTTRATSRTITLTGTVQRVGTNTIMVWEPASRHSGEWVVPNAGRRFRVGQRVSARGTEDRRGKFYVQDITIL